MNLSLYVEAENYQELLVKVENIIGGPLPGTAIKKAAAPLPPAEGDKPQPSGVVATIPSVGAAASSEHVVLVEPAPKKRGRRTAAEIAAANAATVATAQPTPAQTQLAVAVPGPLSDFLNGTGAHAPAKPAAVDDPWPALRAAPIDAVKCRGALMAVSMKHGMTVALGVLAGFGAHRVADLGKLDETKRGDFIDACRAKAQS